MLATLIYAYFVGICAQSKCAESLTTCVQSDLRNCLQSLHECLQSLHECLSSLHAYEAYAYMLIELYVTWINGATCRACMLKETYNKQAKDRSNGRICKISKLIITQKSTIWNVNLGACEYMWLRERACQVRERERRGSCKCHQPPTFKLIKEFSLMSRHT